VEDVDVELDLSIFAVVVDDDDDVAQTADAEVDAELSGTNSAASGLNAKLQFHIPKFFNQFGLLFAFSGGSIACEPSSKCGILFRCSASPSARLITTGACT
jgi:hypothetical protein